MSIYGREAIYRNRCRSQGEIFMMIELIMLAAALLVHGEQGIHLHYMSGACEISRSPFHIRRESIPRKPSGPHLSSQYFRYLHLHCQC